MALDTSTFLTLLYISLFIVVVGHVFLKGMMGEPILRHSTVTSSGSGSGSVSNKLHPSKNELLDYVTTHLNDIERNKYVFNPKGANYYGEFHNSDIHDERQDLSKYFEIEQSVPDTNILLKELQCKDDLKNCKSEIKSKLIDRQTGNPMFFDQGSDGTLTYKPDIWKYENERVMNGGYIDGLRANDGEQSNFAIYPPASQFKDENWHTSYPYLQSTGMW